jgi:MFS family permease
VMGLGVGCAAVAATSAGTEAVEPERRGLASGLLNTAAQLGNALGLSVFVVLAAAVPAGADAGFRVACATAAVVAAAGAVSFARLHRRA